MNLVEGLLEQMNRCRELLKVYAKLPEGAGMFAKMMIEREIKTAEDALGSGDTVAMMKAYATLKGCK